MNAHAPDFFRRPRGPFSPKVLRAALDHAAAEAPRESCGLVRAGVYHPCENVHETPEHAFKITAVATGAAYLAGDLEGVVHSHPGGPGHPSEADMIDQIETAVPWAIVVPGEPDDPKGGELACAWGMPNPPLLDSAGGHNQRTFCHGVADCYSLIRDYFRDLEGVELPEYPRGSEWWRDGRDLYLENLEHAGFRVVSTDPTTYAGIAQPGDVFLRRVMSDVVNHGGVYVGKGLALEQFPKSLSQRRPIGPALPFVTHWLRFVG